MFLSSSAKSCWEKKALAPLTLGCKVPGSLLHHFAMELKGAFWGSTSQSLLPPCSVLSRPRGFWISRRAEFTLSPPSCIPWHKIKVSVVPLLVRDFGYRKLLKKGPHINSLARADRILLGKAGER